MAVQIGQLDAEADYNHDPENVPIKISCASDAYISIQSAVYGPNCKDENYAQDCINGATSCFDQTENLATACNKQNTCEYKVLVDKIGDPAIHCAKTYDYSYKCIPITNNPSMNPTLHPTDSTNMPTNNPSFFPSKYPTELPTFNPTSNPTYSPTYMPTFSPTFSPVPNLKVTVPVAKHTTTQTHFSTILETDRNEYSQITTTNLALSKTNDIEHKAYQIALYTIVSMSLIFICFCLMMRLFIPWYKKRSQKQKCSNNCNDYDYIQLLDTAPTNIKTELETPNGYTPREQYITPQEQYVTPQEQHITPGFITKGGLEMSEMSDKDLLNESDIGEDDNDDDDVLLYAKPSVSINSTVTDGQELSVIHFYYMDDIEEQKNEYNDKELYHEKQKWEMCLLHAINGLLQSKTFTVKSMNDICKQLSPQKLINPHKSVLNTGNYDANVLIMALNKVNIDIQWFDARKANELDLENNEFLKFLEGDNQRFVGFILNKPSTAFKMFNRRHWIAIKQINDIWYNLDSKLKEPKQYKNGKELSVYLVKSLKANNTELMICRKKKSKQSVEMNVVLQW